MIINIKWWSMTSNYDNGNEGTCCNFTSMFQSMFSSMFSSMFTRDRGFIFFRTSMIQVCFVSKKIPKYIFSISNIFLVFQIYFHEKHLKNTWKNTLMFLICMCTFISVVIYMYLILIPLPKSNSPGIVNQGPRSIRSVHGWHFWQR